MQIEEHQWFSPNLHKDMAFKVYGHWGVPILVFPCSLGRYYDYEGMGMIDAITEFIDAGKIKLYCIDTSRRTSALQFENDDLIFAFVQPVARHEQRTQSAPVPETPDVVAVDPNDTHTPMAHVQESAADILQRERSSIERGTGVAGVRVCKARDRFERQ